MKIIMTLLVRDEEDIIGANIDYHLSQGVDFIIATDNRSVDSTARILKGYEARGVLRYIYEESDDYSQGVWVTRMARMACTDHGAHWVINNDADEFWWPVTGTLRDSFAAISPEINILQAQRHNFVAIDGFSGLCLDHMIYRETASLNLFGRALPPKVAHRASPDVVVAQGNHAVDGLEAPMKSEGRIEILHFPIRSYLQIENKIAKGGAAYERNTRLATSVGSTWRALYAQLNGPDKLQGYFDEIRHDEKRLATKLRTGEIVVDRRLSDYFARLASSRAMLEQ